jgi:hypothetical protein
MKIADIPNSALSAQPTPIPMKVVYDWDVMLDVLLKQGFVIIESDNNRTTTVGGVECVPVKAFNSYIRTTKKMKLYTKRISANRWFCTL